MKVLKNSYLSKMYGVHPSTIMNWIEAAKNQRNGLQTAEVDGKTRILDTANNHLLMKQLSQKGRKHKPKEFHKVITPRPEFYEIFNQQQLSEIITSLETYQEIPHKFTYLNGGAEHWHKYVLRSFEEKISNTVTNTAEMLDNSFDFIVSLLDQDQKMNIIEIGPGDGNPSIKFIKKTQAQNKLNRYIAVDISPEMLDIAESDLSKKLQECNVNFSRITRDISTSTIRDITFYNSKSIENKNSRNIVMFIGSTIENQTNYFQVIQNLKNSLVKKDILVVGETLDTDSAKSYFDFAIEEAGSEHTLELWIPRLMGFDDALYTFESIYDDKENIRKTQLSLESDLDIKFQYSNLEAEVFFKKSDKIVVWRHKHHTMQEIVVNYEKTGLRIKAILTSKDMAQALIVCELKS